MFYTKMVVARSPCSSCLIIGSLNQRALQKLADSREDVTFELVEIDHPSELAKIPGIEVEKLPAILINEEQISAGSIVPGRKLAEWME